MSILRRKKREEEEEKNITRDKNNPDDSSNKKTRRKKKGEIVPWTKKERALVFWVLTITVLTSSMLAMSARSWKLPNFPRIKLPSFSSSPIVIEGNKTGQKKAKEAISLFINKTNPLSGVFGLYVYRLGDKSSYGVNENEVFQAASLIKLPAMIAMYQKSEAGELDIETAYKLKNSDKVGGSGSLYYEKEGTALTYRELVELMGKQSDNTAFGIAKNILGEEEINKTIENIGMSKTSLEENETSPADIGLLFSRLWELELINEKDRDELLGYMTDTIYENWMAAGLPGIRVAHKYGREVHVVNDAGIVFSDDPFILVILSKGVVEREADEIFPELSRIIYQVESSNY